MNDVRQGGLQYHTIKEFRLKSGTVMPEAVIAYRSLGTLAPDGKNAVLVTHGYTSGPDMIAPGGTAGEGGWQELVGPGKPIDTQRYFVVCPNMLGSSYGSTNGASVDPATGRPYGSRFPAISVSDIVASQKKLLDALGVRRLVAAAGPSYGGFQGFQWAVDFPDFVGGVVAAVSAPRRERATAEANVMRTLALLSEDPNWNGGNYYDRGGVLETMTRLRMATLIGYGIEAKLRETMTDPAAISAAVRERAAGWAAGFDANSLVILGRAMIGFDTMPRFREIRAKMLYVLSRTDALFPPPLTEWVMPALRDAGVDADYFEIDSEFGHMASGLDAGKWAGRLRAFIEALG